MSDEIPIVSEKIRAMLRKAAQIVSNKGKGGKVNTLNELSDKQLVDIYFRLEKGEDIRDIRRLLQVEWRIAPNSHMYKVMGDLKRFKDAVLTPVQKALSEAEGMNKAKITVAVRRILDELDGMGSLRWMINEQMKRLTMWREREDNMKMPLIATNAVMRDLGDLLDKYIQKEIDLGLLEPTESKREIMLKEKFLNFITHNVQNSGKNLLDATTKFIKDAEEEAVIITVDGQEIEDE